MTTAANAPALEVERDDYLAEILSKVPRVTLAFWIVKIFATILVSNTLGTALGDFVATTTGLGFEGGALVFAGLIAVVAVLHVLTDIPGSVLFWTAYVLTRPLGATLGDILTKPHAQGGLNLSRIMSSLVIAVLMVFLVSAT